MFDIFPIFYFVTCTAIFIRLVRGVLKRRDLTLEDIVSSLCLSYIPGLNFVAAADILKVVFDKIAEKAKNITVWKKKDEAK